MAAGEARVQVCHCNHAALLTLRKTQPDSLSASIMKMGLLPGSLPCRRAQHAHFCLQEGLLSAQLSLDQDVFVDFECF